MTTEEENMEAVQLRQLKLEAFKLAERIKPSEHNIHGQLNNKYTVKQLIKDAEEIYQALLNK